MAAPLVVGHRSFVWRTVLDCPGRTRIRLTEKDISTGQLILTRRDGERIHLSIDPGADIEQLVQQLQSGGITIQINTGISSGQVRIGIDAPRDISILRGELIDRAPQPEAGSRGRLSELLAAARRHFLRA